MQALHYVLDVIIQAAEESTTDSDGFYFLLEQVCACTYKFRVVVFDSIDNYPCILDNHDSGNGSSALCTSSFRPLPISTQKECSQNLMMTRYKNIENVML